MDYAAAAVCRCFANHQFASGEILSESIIRRGWANRKCNFFPCRRDRNYSQRNSPPPFLSGILLASDQTYLSYGDSGRQHLCCANRARVAELELGRLAARISVSHALGIHCANHGILYTLLLFA